MRLAFKKLFESGPDSAKTSQHSATIQEVQNMVYLVSFDGFGRENDAWVDEGYIRLR